LTTSTTTKTHRALASLKLPKPNPTLITYAQGIVKGMTGNAYFPAPSPALAAVSAAIADLQSAETQALTRAKGAAAARNEKRATLVSLLQQERSYIQGIADGSPENGASIIQSAGLVVKKVPTHTPRVFAAKPGTVSGAVKLVAPAAGPRASYEWEYSTDGGKTWATMPPTIQSKTSITGLTSGSSVQFRYRAVTPKGGAGDWSLPITMPLVK
jgi:hypothetical protein